MAHFSFDSTANDLSTNKNHGVAYNLEPAKDRCGNEKSCYYFNGTNAYIAVPNSPSLNPQDQLTINLWLKFSTLTNRYIPVLHKGGFLTPTPVLLLMRIL